MRISKWLACGVILGSIASTSPSWAENTAPKPVFYIKAFDVTGNTLLNRSAVEMAVYPYMGQAKSMDDIESARAELEKAYHAAGFATVLVNVPEQRVTSGIVKLEVVESRIGKVMVSGSRYYSIDDIRESVPSLQAGGHLNIQQARNELNALNKLSPHRSITPILKPGKRPGTVDVNLRVKDEFPAKTSIEINDRYTSNTSKTRLWLNAGYENLWQRHHALNLQYQTSPENTDEVSVLVGTYVMPVNEGEHKLAWYWVKSESEVPATGDLSVLGDGTIFGVRYVVPMLAINNYSHSVTLGTDYKDFDDAIFFSNGDQATQTKLSYAQFSLNYKGTAYQEKSTLDFSVSANAGISGLGNSEDEFSDKRIIVKADPNDMQIIDVIDRASPSYFYVDASLSYEQFIRESGWRGFTQLGMQWTEDLLVSNEQFGVGGVDSVRGYVESQNIGDYGYFGQLELRSPNWLQSVESFQDSYAFIFADGGKVRMVQTNPEEDKKFTISSVGLGFSASALEQLTLSLQWAHPLETQGDVEKGDERAHFSVAYSF